MSNFLGRFLSLQKHISAPCKMIFRSNIWVKYHHTITNKMSSKTTSGDTRYGFKYPLVLLAGVLAAPVRNDEENTSKEDDSQIVMMIKHAILAQMKDEDEKAEMYLHKALKLADEKYNKKKLSKIEYLNIRIYIYDTLANNAFLRQDFKNAEILFKETMKGYIEGGKDSKDNAIIEMSLKLATIYAMQKRDNEAVHGYEFCINTQKEKLAENPGDEDTRGFLGMALEGYGRYLLFKKQLHQSIVMLTEAFDIAKSLLGEQASQTLVIMNDLATVYLLMKDFDQAEQLLKLAIKNGENSEICATLYSNLGAVYLGKSWLSETETACKRSLELAKLNKDQFAINQAKECLSKLKEARKGVK